MRAIADTNNMKRIKKSSDAFSVFVLAVFLFVWSRMQVCFRIRSHMLLLVAEILTIRLSKRYLYIYLLS